MPSYSNSKGFNRIHVPIFELDTTGAIKPNVLFHRSLDKLHSRCIEYPFAASQLGEAQCVLDVGTVKADPTWIAWLESLPIDVHATDYDEPTKPFHNLVFHQADVRSLPIPDNTFDKILAVSVIEHIGLHSPQVLSDPLPRFSQSGDLEAVKELTRVLKPNGQLVMTLPFGLKDELILGKQARNYTSRSIKKFESLLEPLLLEYYEYQYKTKVKLHNDLLSCLAQIHFVKRLWSFAKLRSFVKRVYGSFFENVPMDTSSVGPGVVTWRRVPAAQTKALHRNHTEGVICGVWEKRE